LISDELILLLKDSSIPLDKGKLKALYTVYKKYKNDKRSFAEIKDENGEYRFKTIEQYNKVIRNECYNISSNIYELANLAVAICYEMHPNDNKVFAWSVFGEGIIKNIEKNRQNVLEVPFLDEVGDIEYLGNRFSKKEITIKENFEYDIL
jgi:hypothetical protein